MLCLEVPYLTYCSVVFLNTRTLLLGDAFGCMSFGGGEEEKQIFLQLSVVFHLDSIVLTTKPMGRKRSKISC